MSSIISQVTEHPEFIDMVAREIATEVCSRQGKAYHAVAGHIAGGVTHYELQSDLEFSDPSGRDFEWHIPFNGNGTATVKAKTADGEFFESDIPGLCDGLVEVTFPAETLLLNDIEQIISEIDTTTTVYTVPLDAPKS